MPGDGKTRAFDATTLPPVTAVHVRALRRGGRTSVVEGDAAEAIAALWRALPAGQQRRCFDPVYELEFVADGKAACVASVCWTCHNARVEAGGESFTREFDADSPAARALLDALRRAAGDA